MTSIENSELDFSELDQADDYTIDLFFNGLIDYISIFRESLDDEDYIKSLDKDQLLELKSYYDRIYELFIDWELVDNMEDISYITLVIDELLEKFQK
jgi:hypothetical protein